ncbi:Extracellular signal-regulated kinase 7 like protein [Argiope bruennichi]|uniref:non-specific serine/threonine protein kinase n=1 Tax=Argiope bruennichi TaxID=94029 RepID=A0A8T0E2J6_ARGBR|nr:Extracellular signal-regulated kinase 7 like protein [Argiope bruennichi]
MAENKESNDEGEKTVKKRRRSEDVDLTIEILKSEKYFSVKKLLGRGTYGDVFMMYDPARDSNVAVKIITSENIAKIELAMWPKLRHPNIVPVLEVMTLRPVEVAIFVMPVQRKSLHDIMYDKRFLSRDDSLDYLKIWLFQTLCALDYLDSRHLCHLDIKVDNILISNEYRAMLSDFSFLNFNTKRLERYDLGLPYIYRPPEACQTLGSDIFIDGRSYDMWGFGIMAVEIFTHFVLATNVPDCKNWMKEVYPTLFSILQEKEFSNLMIQTFPGYNMSQTQAKLALNFIYCFLMLEPLERSIAVEALQHQFLNRGEYLASWTDPIWTQEVYSKSAELPSVISWKKKSSYHIDGKIDEGEDRKVRDEYSPATDDEYLTVSDSDDDTKDSDSINEYMNTLSEKDRSRFGSSKMEQSNSNENLIDGDIFKKSSESNSEFDLIHMGDVSTIGEDDRNLSLLNSEINLSILPNDMKQYTDKNAYKEYSISQSDSKFISKGLKKKQILNKKSRLHRYPMKSKMFLLNSEVYNSPCSDIPLKTIPNPSVLLKKLHDKKISKAGSNGKKTFYKIRKKNCNMSNTEKYITSDILPSASDSLMSDNNEISTITADSKQNDSSGKNKCSEYQNDIQTLTNANVASELNEESSIAATGDNFLSEMCNLIELDDFDNPSTSCKGIIPSVKAASAILKDNEACQSSDINEASDFIVSVNKTLGQLNQINNILQKVLICENCNSKRKKIEQENIKNGILEEMKPDYVPLEFRNSSREIKEDEADDSNNLRRNLNVCCHEIICKDSSLPLNIMNSQNVNLIINCPAMHKEIHQPEDSNEKKQESCPESKSK